MNEIEIQKVSKMTGIPSESQFQSWVDAALTGYGKDAEIVIRIVDKDEISQLNRDYRHKKGATNILSFPVDVPEGIELDLLGDLIVCAPVIVEEANIQNKHQEDHWAHIIVHGVLHLLGCDHLEDEEAEIMENKEIAILATLNIDNPYKEAYKA